MTKDPDKQDNYLIKFSGKGASIPEPLSIGKNYKVTIEGTVSGHDERDENDGSYTHYYRLEPVRVELVDDAGHSIKAKDTRSVSQRTRAWFFKAWANIGADYTFDELWEGVNRIVCGRRDLLIDEFEKIREREERGR